MSSFFTAAYAWTLVVFFSAFAHVHIYGMLFTPSIDSVERSESGHKHRHHSSHSKSAADVHNTQLPTYERDEYRHSQEMTSNSPSSEEEALVKHEVLPSSESKFRTKSVTRNGFSSTYRNTHNGKEVAPKPTRGGESTFNRETNSIPQTKPSSKHAQPPTEEIPRDRKYVSNFNISDLEKTTNLPKKDEIKNMPSNFKNEEIELKKERLESIEKNIIDAAKHSEPSALDPETHKSEVGDNPTDIQGGDTSAHADDKIFTNDFIDVDDNNTAADYYDDYYPAYDEKTICTSCHAREREKQARVESLKMQILRLLNMEQPPNMTHVTLPKIPSLKRLYDMAPGMMADSPMGGKGGHHYDDNDDEYRVKTQQIFTMAKSVPDELGLNITDGVYFSPPAQLYNSKIRRAHLWFFVLPDTSDDGKEEDWPSSRRSHKPLSPARKSRVTITISRILPESVQAGRAITKTVYSRIQPGSKSAGWKRIDIRDLMRRWVRYPMSNIGLQIRVLDKAGRNRVVLPPATERDKGYEPWLETKIIEGQSKSRHRRDEALVCDVNSRERRCCRYPLEISFIDLGWEWVIAPMNTRVDYCAGECHMALLDGTPHSYIMQNVDGAGTSCCVGTRMQALSMLYFGTDHQILLQELQGIKVERCGCL